MTREEKLAFLARFAEESTPDEWRQCFAYANHIVNALRTGKARLEPAEFVEAYKAQREATGAGIAARGA